jgi:hypothetical protein
VGVTGNVCHEVVATLHQYPYRVHLDSIVSITTRRGPDSPAIESRVKKIFPKRSDRPWGTSTFLIMGTGSFPGTKPRGQGAGHLTHLEPK